MDTNLTLLTDAEQQLRLGRIRRLMADAGLDAILLSDFANLYYLTGRVYAGYAYIGINEGDSIFFVKRPVDLAGDGVVQIRKPEQMAVSTGLQTPATLGLAMDMITASAAARLGAVFAGSEIRDCSMIMRRARSVKTPCEIGQIRLSGVKQEAVYRRIPGLYRPGMTDIELQIEIERALRLDGCLGQFRISGDTMEIYIGNVLAGDNADNPSPYDFAMGGAGLDPSLPVGANGSLIEPDTSVMVDVCGNFTGYMTDMSRTFACGELSREAMRAHRCSIEICERLACEGRPGVEARELYRIACEMAEAEGLADYFMGHRQHAGFIGHGVGIEINELPVIAPRSRDVLKENNVIALEPKFVIPGTGPVGIENTYIVGSEGMECITGAPHGLIRLDN